MGYCNEGEALNDKEKSNLVLERQDKEVIEMKWVYKTKLNIDGYINEHKDRLVVKG